MVDRAILLEVASGPRDEGSVCMAVERVYGVTWLDTMLSVQRLVNSGLVRRFELQEPMFTWDMIEIRTMF